MNKPRTNHNTQAPELRHRLEHFECWRVKVGLLPFGKSAPNYVPYKRGQMQLRQMAAIFEEALVYGSRALRENDSRVKPLLKMQNNKEIKKGTKKTWSLVVGRIVAQDPGRSGIINVEKAFIILARK